MPASANRRNRTRATTPGAGQPDAPDVARHQQYSHHPVSSGKVAARWVARWTLGMGLAHGSSPFLTTRGARRLRPLAEGLVAEVREPAPEDLMTCSAPWTSAGGMILRSISR